MEVKLSSKNQIVVPKEVRKQLGLRPGDRLRIQPGKDAATLTRAPSIEEKLTALMHMSPSTQTHAVRRIRKLRDEWNT